MTDEKIGFHKGAMQTLIGEKTELLKMINTVDQLIQAHNTALKEQGIDYIEELKKLQGEQQSQQQQQPSPSKEQPVEELQTPEPQETQEQPKDFDYEEPERLP